MLNKLLKIIVILFLLSLSIKGQITDDFKNRILQNLADPKKSWTVIGLVTELNITDAIPVLESNIWENKAYIQLRFLYALAYLKSPNTQNLALAFIDSVDHYDEAKMRNETYLGAKAHVNETLFMINDYSKADYVIQQLRVDPFDDEAIWMLPDLINHLPQYRDEVKSILLNIANDAEEYRVRFDAVYQLEEIFGSEMIPLYIKFFKNINEPSDSTDRFDYTRITSFDFLCKYNYSGLENLIKDQLYKEPASAWRINFIDTLLSRYGTPENIIFVTNYLTQETDTLVKDIENYNLENFSPKQLPKTISISQMIDSLIITTNKCYAFQWIDDNLNNTLNGYLDNAKNVLANSDSFNCSKQIKSFQQKVDFEYIDTLNTTLSFVTVDGYKFLHYYAQYILDRLPALPPPGLTIALKSSTGSFLTSGSLRYYEGGWKDAVNNNDGTFTIDTQLKTISLRMTYEYGTQTKSNVIVGSDTIVFQTVNTQVQLKNSMNELMPFPMGNDGMVQYYAGGWRTFGTITDGVAAKELLPNTYSFRMTYAFANKDKQQNIGDDPVVVFQTVTANVQLKNSMGEWLNGGTVQYYAGAWRNFGTITDGLLVKELLPNNYSFRMTYAYANKDKQQDLSVNPLVVFQTVAANVQLQNSLGNLIDQGTVQYYSGAWRNFGTTTNGVAVKELLPNNYSFRMTYAFANKDKQQDVSINPTVVFQTVTANVQLQNSLSNFIDQGTVQYYSGAWREFGTTVNGVATKELLPNNYSFRMTYEYISNDKAQDISINSTVNFSTVLCTIRVKDAQNNPVNDALASYYSGAWRQIGNTVNGEITKELLPANLSFRIKYGIIQQDKQQNIGTNNLVEFNLQP